MKNPKNSVFTLSFYISKLCFNLGDGNVIFEMFVKNLSEYDFIYNRHTDFYLQNPISQILRQAFENKNWTLSPQPFDYYLLADKQRLTDWSQNEFLESFLEKEDCEYFRNHIPKCQTILPENAEEIWSQRKKLFFKPLRSFGSKQSYKGSSISRKAYIDLIQTETLAQTYCPSQRNSSINTRRTSII
jgi:hypothetical protein